MIPLLSKDKADFFVRDPSNGGKFSCPLKLLEIAEKNNANDMIKLLQSSFSSGKKKAGEASAASQTEPGTRHHKLSRHVYNIVTCEDPDFEIGFAD